MRYRKVTSMDMSISEVGLGCWAFSGENEGWDGYDEEKSIETIHQALDIGINLFDVAPRYGFGNAEKVLGKALKGKNRESVIIASKCGLVWDSQFNTRNDLSPKSIEKEIDASLNRLQTDYIDIYQMHWPDPSTPISETMNTLVKLKEQGRIRYIGASNFSLSLNKEAELYGVISSQQGLYNMIERNASSYHNIPLDYRTEDEILPYCKSNGQAFFPYSPLFQGLLTGTFSNKNNFSNKDIRTENPKLQGSEFIDYYNLVLNLKHYSESAIGKPLNEVAINWLLFNEAVTSVINGAQNQAHILANAKAAEWTLTQQEYDQLNRIVKEGLAPN